MPKPELCELNTLQSILTDAFNEISRIDNSIDSHYTVGTAVTDIPIHMSMTRRGELVKQIEPPGYRPALANDDSLQIFDSTDTNKTTCNSKQL